MTLQMALVKTELATFVVDRNVDNFANARMKATKEHQSMKYDYQLLFCDGKDDESEFPKDVFRLREEVKQARGIILGTPEYHGGYSGVLENALDLMGFEEFEGKMLGLLGVSGEAGADEGDDGFRILA
jgi:NAD(P)H-dependent FMN reductase